MKKILIAIVATLLTTDVSAYCEFFKELCCITTPPTCYPKYENPCYKEPCIPRCGWFIDAEFLYWSVEEEGLNYGPSIIKEVVIDNVITTEFTKITDKKLSSSWNPGFRIGVGKDNAWNSWDLEVLWTSMNSHKHARIDDDNFMHWDLHFNTVDGLFIRDFRYCMIDFRPYAGVRGAFICQKAHIFDVDTFITLGGESIPIIVDQNNKQNFTGVGPLLGVRGEFGFCHCFSVYGEVSGSALFGRFRVKCSERDTIIDISNRTNSHRNPCRCLGVLDAGGGVTWDTSFCKNMIGLELFVGYEYHRYFNQDFIGDEGDLILQGLTIGAQTSF